MINNDYKCIYSQLIYMYTLHIYTHIYTIHILYTYTETDDFRYNSITYRT